MNNSNENTADYDYIIGIVSAGGKAMNDVKPEQLADVYKEMASIIGIENTLLFYASFKGQQISFPSRLFSKEYIRSCILKEYNGSNIRYLSKEYGYSERWIREIISNK